jgi:hypothetical protein
MRAGAAEPDGPATGSGATDGVVGRQADWASLPGLGSGRRALGKIRVGAAVAAQ